MSKKPLRPTANQPFAVLSDVHGNAAALEAVLAELAREAIVDIYVAGDLLLGGDDPLRVWQRLVQVNARCVRGPSDIALTTMSAERLRPATEDERRKRDVFVRTQQAIGDVGLAWLRRLPEQVRMPMLDGGEMLVVHGSPLDATEEMWHSMSEEELNALLADDPADYVFCGGSHVPFDRQVAETHVVNVGSVGASPEGGTAHYTVVLPRADGATIDQRWITLPTK